MGLWFIRVAVVYVVIGVIMGFVMGVTKHFEYHDVHAHINLLGWATLALAGVLYTLFPSAGNNTLAKVHFWMHNIGLPIFMLGLYLSVPNNESVVPLIATGATITVLAIIVFALNILMNAKTAIVTA